MKPTLLLDFDGTLSDPVLLFEQYVSALTEELTEAHGGEGEAWRSLTRTMLWDLTQDFANYFSANPFADYHPYMNALYTRSTQIVCEHIGRPLPNDPVRFARDMQARSLRCCNAFYEDAAEALALLHQQGYRIVMASGQESEFLQAALEGAGVGSIPQGWFGPDLINCAKESTRYFERIFDALNLSPNEAIVIDDLAPAVLWAEELGAKAVQAQLANSQPRELSTPSRPVLTSWLDFPQRLAELLK